MGGLVVIGSGPAGVAAATTYRDRGGDGSVLLVSADGDAPYERPPLSKDVLAGDGPAEPTPITPDDPELSGIEVRLDTTVAGLDLDGRRLRLTGGEDVGFDRLVIATGARPAPPPGAGGARVLRSLADARALVSAAESARSAIVLGSGFIGCEAAASLASRGIEVTMITRSAAPQRDRLGEFASHRLLQWLSDLGVTVRTGASVAGMGEDGTVTMEGDEHARADLVLSALGIHGSVDWSADDWPGSLQAQDGRLLVDDHFRTGVDGVWAAGDAALAEHAVAGRRIATEHWDDAMTQGTIAGENAAGGDRAWREVPSFWSDIGEHPLQYAGWGGGFDSETVREDDEGFTVWYGKGGRLVAALTSNHYDDDDRAKELITAGDPVPEA